MPDIEDSQTDISGDPQGAPTRPMSPKQVKGSQQASVNRTQLPTNGSAQPRTGENVGGKPDNKSDGGGAQQESQNGSGNDLGSQLLQDTGITPGLQLAGALGKEIGASKQQADTALAFNPAYGQDWAKQAVEAPMQSYFIARHIYDAYYGAFLDPNAISASVHDIWHQDDAVGWLMRMGAATTPGIAAEQQFFGLSQEDVVAGGASQLLPMGADPSNLLYVGATARGLELVAKMLLPSIAAAIFTDRHSASDMAWAIGPAMLFGGKGKWVEPIVKEVPGAAKVLERLSAAKLAMDARRSADQDVRQFVARMQQERPKDPVNFGSAFTAGMQGKGKEWELQTGKELMAKYGTLEPEALTRAMVEAGEPIDKVRTVWTYLIKGGHDLLMPHPAEPALVDPVMSFLKMPSASVNAARDTHGWTNVLLHQMQLGAAGNASAPEASMWRSFIGLKRTSRVAVDNWSSKLLEAVGAEATNPQEVELLSKALEGDEVAYHSQTAAGSFARDTMRWVMAGLNLAGHESEYTENEIANFSPRLHILIKDGKQFRASRPASDLFTRDPQKHRVLTVRPVDLLTETRLQVEQKYTSEAEAQAAQERLRGDIVRKILGGDPLEEIEGIIPQVHGKEISLIRGGALLDPEVARAEAERFAERVAPDFVMNAYEAVPRYVQGRLDAINTHRAVGDLLNATGKDGKAIAVERTGDERAMKDLAAQGYVPVNVPGFERVLVNAKFGKLLERATRLAGAKPRDIKAELALSLKALRELRPGESFAHLKEAIPTLLELESTAIATIMYSPRIHGMNMASRLGILGALHPSEVSEWFGKGLLQKGGGTMLPPTIPGIRGFEGTSPDAYRSYAWTQGVITPHQVKGLQNGFAEASLDTLGRLTGDQEIMTRPLVQDQSGGTAAMKNSAALRAVGNASGQVRDLLFGKQGELWSWVSDFGVMAFWVELSAALKSGRFRSAAQKALEARGGSFTTEELQRQERDMADKWAARRANSWMGHVAPEDTNPVMHAMARSIAFAPNWWRSWAELLTGYYKNAGFGWSKDTIAYVVQNEVKTALAAVALQQLSANAMNMMFSGHTIYQNDPGNWGKIEITNPHVIDVLNSVFNLGIDPKTGRNAKGAKLTMENPLARQTVDTEQAMGLLTSAPHWSPESFQQGAAQFAGGRLSPVASSIAALGNIDLYRTVASGDGSWRYIDPTNDHVFGNPGADALSSVLQLTPFSGISQQMQQAILADQGAGNVAGPFGTQVPKVVLDSFSGSNLGSDLMKAFMVGMTGVNAPYMRSAKSFGVTPTDDQYKAVHEDQVQYETNMSALSSGFMSGQIPPDKALAAYRQLSTKHANQMQTDFKHAPEYLNGPLGLTNSWEGLYDQATDQYGVLDSDKLRALQSQWRQQHSAADYAAVQSELRVNDQKYPMLALYHKTLDSYYAWQGDWAKENGVDLNTLQSDLAGWSAVYNDRNASRQWLASHPELEQYEAAKKSEFETGNSKYGMSGLMYTLFFNPTLADELLASTGQTQTQVEQAAGQLPDVPQQ